MSSGNRDVHCNSSVNPTAIVRDRHRESVYGSLHAILTRQTPSIFIHLHLPLEYNTYNIVSPCTEMQSSGLNVQPADLKIDHQVTHHTSRTTVV